MKILYIVLGVVVIAFIAIQAFALRSQWNIETYPYEVERKMKSFEIRKYESSLFTSVQLSSSSYEEGSRKGFSVLAGYIFGGNDRNEKIAMTSPVTMSLQDSMTMMFMVPKKFNRESLPKPNESRVEFKDVPAKTVAAISFGGWANQKKIERYKQNLIQALELEHIKYTSNFYFLGYNAPYEFFNRKNEIIVELE